VHLLQVTRESITRNKNNEWRNYTLNHEM